MTRHSEYCRCVFLLSSCQNIAVSGLTRRTVVAGLYVAPAKVKYLLLQNPGMAQQLVHAQQTAAAASPEQREKLAALKGDPDLKLVFDDIEANGPSETLLYIVTMFFGTACDMALVQLLQALN